VAEDDIELVTPIVFEPTFKVEPEEAIEETAFICMCPMAEIEAGPEANDTALTVNSGATTKVAELDKLAVPSNSGAEDAAIVAIEESVELPVLSTVPVTETVPEEFKADTDLSVNSGVEDTDPTEDKDAENVDSIEDSELTEAEPKMEDTPPIITTPEEGLEPVLVNRLAAPNSRIPTSVMEAEAGIEDAADIVSAATLVTDPVEDRDAKNSISTEGSELTEAEPEIDNTPPISRLAEDGEEPMLVIKLAAPNSRIPTSVIEAEADIEEATDIV